MPDLIIKPAAQSGNKVIIQDQAGGAVITTADSGATIANATLTSPTLVTPALGTPASGVLTNATFPAGHVIQTVTKNVDQGTTSMTGTTWVATYNTCAITPQRNNSKILVQFNVPLTATKDVSANDGGGIVGIFRDVGGAGYGASPIIDFNNGDTQVGFYLYLNQTTHSAQAASRNSYTYLDSPATLSAVTYKLYLKQWATRGNFSSNQWSAITGWVLQEIAQ